MNSATPTSAHWRYRGCAVAIRLMAFEDSVHAGLLIRVRGGVLPSSARVVEYIVEHHDAQSTLVEARALARDVIDRAQP